MRNSCLAAVAALLCGACLVAPAALAQPVARLDTRDATVYLSYGGGFATAGKNGAAGAEQPVDITGPATLAVQGADAFVGSYLEWGVSWQMQWDLQQSWHLGADGHTLFGSGATLLAQANMVVGPGCEPQCPAAVAMTARNEQELQFTLDAPTAYHFHSEVSQEQGVSINRWDEARQRWQLVVFSVPGGVADRSGTLGPGRWQLVNSRTSHVLGSTPQALAQTWSFSLTLTDTPWVSVVPEPASAPLLAAGLGLLALAARLRRRVRAGAALCTATLALVGAPSWSAVTTVQATGSSGGDMQVLIPGFDTQAASLPGSDAVPMVSGVPHAGQLPLAWELELDRPALRTMGNGLISHEQVFSLQALSPGQDRINWSGSVAGTADWFVEDGAGNPVEGGLWTQLTEIEGTQVFNLPTATDVRWSGALSIDADDRSDWSAELMVIESSGVPRVQKFLADADGQSFELAFQAPAGPLLVYSSLQLAGRQPCCGPALSARLAMNHTLELSAAPAVPEPAAAWLLLAGMAALRLRRRR